MLIAGVIGEVKPGPPRLRKSPLQVVRRMMSYVTKCLSGNFSLKTLDESRHGLPNMLLSGTSFNFAIWKSESNQTHVSGRTLRAAWQRQPHPVPHPLQRRQHGLIVVYRWQPGVAIHRGVAHQFKPEPDAARGPTLAPHTARRLDQQ